MFEAGGGGGGMTAHQIYVALTGGPGTGSLQDAYGTARIEAEAEAERAKMIQKLAEKIEAGWQGQAGAAAFGAAKPLAEVSLIGAANLQKTHILLEQQADGFQSASSSVVPVAEKAPETGFWDDISPWDTDTEEEQARHKAESEHNIHVYRMYDNQSMDNEQELPMDYSTLSDPGGAILIQQPADPGENRPPDDGSGKWTPPPGTGDDRGKVTPPPVKPGDNGWVDPGDVPQPTDPQQTRPNDWVPTKPTEPVQPRPPINVNPNVPPNQVNPLYPVGPGGGNQQGPGGPRSSSGGGGPRGGGGGLASRGGFGGGAAASEHGAGARSGAVGGEPHGAGGRGAGAAAGGRGGAGAGGGMGGGGKGQGGEDSEHTRASFLIEDDPDAIFGTDEITAPPVIGG